MHGPIYRRYSVETAVAGFKWMAHLCAENQNSVRLGIITVWFTLDEIKDVLRKLSAKVQEEQSSRRRD